MALAPVGSWACLREAGSSGQSPGPDRGRPLRQAECSWCWQCCGWGGESCELTPHSSLEPEPLGSTSASSPGLPLLTRGAIITHVLLRALGTEIMECTCSPHTLGKAGQGDGNRWAQGGGSSSLVRQSFPLLGGRTAGRFVYSL